MNLPLKTVAAAAAAFAAGTLFLPPASAASTHHHSLHRHPMARRHAATMRHSKAQPMRGAHRMMKTVAPPRPPLSVAPVVQ